jgi:DNA-binding MarR family transcriptional regulator
MIVELDSVHLPLQIATREIGRICRDLERYRANLCYNLENTDVSSGHLHNANSQPDDVQLRNSAKRLIRDRRKRDGCFPTASFADPQWDILLDLFVEKLSGRVVGVSSASLAASVPSTTALRHLSVMVENGLIERTRCAHDARLRYVTLTVSAEATMRSYLAQVTGSHS